MSTTEMQSLRLMWRIWDSVLVEDSTRPALTASQLEDFGLQAILEKMNSEFLKHPPV